MITNRSPMTMTHFNHKNQACFWFYRQPTDSIFIAPVENLFFFAALTKHPSKQMQTACLQEKFPWGNLLMPCLPFFQAGIGYNRKQNSILSKLTYEY